MVLKPWCIFLGDSFVQFQCILAMLCVVWNPVLKVLPVCCMSVSSFVLFLETALALVTMSDIYL